MNVIIIIIIIIFWFFPNLCHDPAVRIMNARVLIVRNVVFIRNFDHLALLVSSFYILIIVCSVAMSSDNINLFV